MTTQQEDQAIHNLLPEMAKEPTGFDLGEGSSFNPDELLPVAKRLQAEGLASPTNSYVYYVAITPKGKRIAEREDGYLGYLKEQEKRQRIEERRAWLNATGTFGSMLIAALAFLFSVYIYNKAIEINNLEQKIQAQDARLNALEAQRNR